MNLDTCTPGQRCIVETLDRPLMVSAGAGSGKTFTLTQRIAYALTEPLGDGSPFVQSIDQVMAITFTKKAAAELKSRIKRKLIELDMSAEALKVDDAWISTIHGMCSRILREHALELGLDPFFEVISETEANRLKERAFDQVMLEIDLEDNVALKNYIHSVGVRSFGINAPSVEKYVTALSNRTLALPGGFDSLVVPDVAGDPSQLLRQMVELGREFCEVGSSLSKPTKTDAKHLEACRSALERAFAYLDGGVASSFEDPSFDASGFAAAFYSFPKTSPKYRSKDGDPAFFSMYRTRYAELSLRVEACFDALELRFIAEVARRVHERYQAFKAPRYLDNTDLLRETYAALEAHPQLARSYRDRFRIIMIDEFQDTDELQVSLISRISHEGLDNVCTVGDAQQSIYRFRGADVGVFFSYQDALQERTDDPLFVDLPDNFRSHADVLSFVDRIFSQPTVFGDRFLSLRPKGAVNDEHDEIFSLRPRISMGLFDCPASGPGLAAGRTACAHRIAQHFAELYDAGAEPGDMALLLGSMSNVSLYSEALRELGFDCLVSGGSTFAESYEVSLVSSILTYFANPLDDAATYQILSSPLFSVSDAALMFLATRFDPQGAPHRRSLSEGLLMWGRERSSSPLSESQLDNLDFASGAIKAAASKAARYGLTAGVQELLVLSGWFLRLDQADDAESQAIVGNVYKALRMITELESLGLGTSSTVDRFIRDCETLKLSPGVLSTASQNYVQIMTVHASKGLEFPHVAVAELRLDSPSDQLIVENVDSRSYATVKPKALEPFRDTIKALHGYMEPFDGTEQEVRDAALDQRSLALEALVKRQEVAEARRLLYVALTRASKSLFLGIAYRGKKEPDYTDKGILEDLFCALEWQPSESAPEQYIDYGGSRSMLLEFNVVDASFKEKHPGESYYSLGDDEDLLFDHPRVNRSEGVLDDERMDRDLVLTRRQLRALRMRTSSGHAAGFTIPGRPPAPEVSAQPYLAQDDRVCSYSSLASQCGGAIRSFCVDRIVGDDALDRGSDHQLDCERALFEKGEGAVDASLGSGFLFDDMSEDDGEATALGVAFHRLAQLAIDSHDVPDRSESDSLIRPADSVITAQIALNGLSRHQQIRLDRALNLWFDSDLARDFANHAHCEAEVPFMVAFGPKEDRCFLEGEIDGLAFDVDPRESSSSVAFLVDYKTGGSALETPRELALKHLFQAQCYAYALLKRGFAKVDARFVRVEQEDPTNPGQPQIQAYSFDASQVPYLESTIYQARSERIWSE